MTKDGERMQLVPFLEAANELVEVCREIEAEPETIAEALLARFANSEAHLSASIDRRKAFMSQLKAMKEHGKNEKKAIDRAIKRLEEIEAELKAMTLSVMRDKPDIRFRDSKGQPLSLCKAKRSLKVDYGSTLSLTGVLPGFDREDYSGPGIPHYFIKSMTVYMLDKDAIAFALDNGEKLDWARFETTEYVRGL